MRTDHLRLGRLKRGVPARLADDGVNKNLAKRARAAAALSEEKHEAEVKKAVAIAVAAVDGNKEVIKAALREARKLSKGVPGVIPENHIRAYRWCRPDKIGVL